MKSVINIHEKEDLPGWIPEQVRRPGQIDQEPGATASNCFTCPMLKERRNEPSIGGAWRPLKIFLIPSWRSKAMSLIESARRP